ncbi:hypothetical protein KNP414_02512 [Paenibacillus mucilaginosus KNP414]|uniref:Uncharacterized protein n=1 Tax=Paenibacillus mucilaginosus (strain KNP414) TaxID=1036673 RepID=F8FAI4_PAEMK|nr:hypothetical protein KNP414_02512 [Paenibacillus mucilaginosus KNP414]
MLTARPAFHSFILHYLPLPRNLSRRVQVWRRQLTGYAKDAHPVG